MIKEKGKKGERERERERETEKGKERYRQTVTMERQDNIIRKARHRRNCQTKQKDKSHTNMKGKWQQQKIESG